ncbi:MAG: potassium-transporting ATPase subunit KdpC [Actinomycetota bacterium]|jgi:K+-transporting ATPase ATPase C chain|nr:potassium-transporting ATPase subunit KdpC [Actinomycetota bacterium]
MLLHLRRSLVAALFFLVLCGLAYPLAGTGLAQVAFHHQANGSIGPDGSSLIGQQWTGPRWFQGRPSATVGPTGSPSPYDAMASGASNLGPRSTVLASHVAARAAALRKEGITPTAGMVTSSGSGLDPDISPAAAYAQVGAVARARHLPAAAVRRLVTSHISPAQLGFLGEPVVNVLSLNEALARLR